MQKSVGSKEKGAQSKSKGSKILSKQDDKGLVKEQGNAAHKDEKGKEKRSPAEGKDHKKEQKQDKQKKTSLQRKGKPKETKHKSHEQKKGSGSVEKLKQKRSTVKSKVLAPKGKQGRIGRNLTENGREERETKKELSSFFSRSNGVREVQGRVSSQTAKACHSKGETQETKKNACITCEQDIGKERVDSLVTKPTTSGKASKPVQEQIDGQLKKTQPEELDKVIGGGAYYHDEGQDDTIEDAPSLKRIFMPPSE
ncbi:hypothetical protein ANCCAN_01976 [Ancylostoma caninum]|uniref:Uncharacterized protein n=1 Tax=Ancylostoma caninum TaxID=29170 RepID=A0A368H847_ANCCA|nr:hypothetical protein ANCCAN_01976 [Ancylostoma caninum]